MQMVGNLADRIHMLDYGCTIADGEPEAALKDPEVFEPRRKERENWERRKSSSGISRHVAAAHISVAFGAKLQPRTCVGPSHHLKYDPAKSSSR